MQRSGRAILAECWRIRALAELQGAVACTSPPTHQLFAAEAPLRRVVLAAWGQGGAPAPATRSAPALALRSFATGPSAAAEPAKGAHNHSHAHHVEIDPSCWSCAKHLPGGHNYFCAGCGRIQPLSLDADYFTLFGFSAPTFDIDLVDLDSRYKRLQVRLHPDRFATMSEPERQNSADQAAAVNQAYQVLKQPMKRAQYMLTLKGMGACEGLTITDPELLEPVMELREEVDAADTPEQLQSILKGVEAEERRCVGDLAAAFAAGDLEHAYEITTVMRYVLRVKEAVIEKM